MSIVGQSFRLSDCVASFSFPESCAVLALRTDAVISLVSSGERVCSGSYWYRLLRIGKLIRKLVPTFSVLWKEIRVGVLVGAGLAAVNFFRLLLTTPHSAEIALTVSLAMFFTVVLAKAVGAMLPLVAGMLRCDPAIMAAPLITTIVDAFALVMYFKIAQAILGLAG